MKLDFIWHLRGSVVLGASTSGDAALRRVERLLDKQRKPVTERGPNYLVFQDPLWREPFGPNWLAMVIYDRGRFWVEGGRVFYELRSLHGMIFCLLGAVMVFLFGLAEGLANGLKLAALAFGWLYGMNILLALARVQSAIRKAVEGA
ncbi:hypothetical protein [Phenylobacterium sp. RIFCSPHIGHO2_01_FULL_69_31]|uniref:hypothetical protein n=1 Tax=Phenylobacterium sp. RIFCSPHIGHO2_01_FULL_69_31 TaxID=1801944 RepID=UPI0025FD7433|nr:hypothetical protein [Phenylobacterium sp. RIFCSPHIGHO2_01_FULL_69_31]